MDASETTGFVTIMKTPSGEAPRWVRRAWVNLTLPCYPTSGYLPGVETDFLSGLPRAKRRRCVVVPQEEALAILKERDPSAAAWWSRHGFPNRQTPNFSFGEDEVRIVSGVRQQKVIEVTDEMRGDPYR